MLWTLNKICTLIRCGLYLSANTIPMRPQIKEMVKSVNFFRSIPQTDFSISESGVDMISLFMLKCTPDHVVSKNIFNFDGTFS